MKIAFYFFSWNVNILVNTGRKTEYLNMELSWKSKNNNYSDSKIILIILKTSLAKWMSVPVLTKWLWVRIPLLSTCMWHNNIISHTKDQLFTCSLNDETFLMQCVYECQWLNWKVSHEGKMKFPNLKTNMLHLI